MFIMFLLVISCSLWFLVVIIISCWFYMILGKFLEVLVGSWWFLGGSCALLFYGIGVSWWFWVVLVVLGFLVVFVGS